MNKKPVFNVGYIISADKSPKKGSNLLLYYIEDIQPKEGYMIFSQMCNCGYRMGRENEDYSKWNGCVFEDIDYKKYIENHKDFIDPIEIYERIYEYLYNNYRDILYYSELSKSKKGFHFIFYFDVAPTKNNRLMCKALSNFMIHRSFEECGYKEIIEYPEVYDDCSDSFFQACFLTKNNYHINEESTGLNGDKYIINDYFKVKEIYENLTKKQYKRVNSTTNTNEKDKKWSIEFEIYDGINYNIEYMNHHERWRLYDSLSGLCGNDSERLKEEWDRCARQLKEGNGHDTGFYLNEPYKNHWDEKRNPNNYIDTDLLQLFGYKINFKNNINIDKDGYNFKQKNYSKRKERIYL